MEKETLSNYGWIVIAVLVLAVMIALATPFGTYIKTGVENTATGLFDTSENALNVVGMSASDSSSSQTKEKVWVEKEWDGFTNIRGNYVWTDGTNICYSNANFYLGTKGSYVLNGNTWEEKPWNGLNGFYGYNVWTDGTNIYCSLDGSQGYAQYVLK